MKIDSSTAGYCAGYCGRVHSQEMVEQVAHFLRISVRFPLIIFFAYCSIVIFSHLLMKRRRLNQFFCRVSSLKAANTMATAKIDGNVDDMDNVDYMPAKYGKVVDRKRKRSDGYGEDVEAAKPAVRFLELKMLCILGINVCGRRRHV